MKMSVDDASALAAAASNSEPLLCDSDGAVTNHSLLDAEDEVALLQAPCLTPKSLAQSNNSLSQKDDYQSDSAADVFNDSSKYVFSSSSDTEDADVSIGSIQKPVESQPLTLLMK